MGNIMQQLRFFFILGGYLFLEAAAVNPMKQMFATACKTPSLVVDGMR